MWLIELAAERDAAPLEPGDLTPEQRGNLTDLKTKGFVSSYEDEGVTWVTILNKPTDVGQLEVARLIMSRCINDLGPGFGGFSPVDLLLDQMPGLKSPDEARALVDLIQEGA